MAEGDQVPSFSIAEGQDFAKFLIKKGFLTEFCKTVDPILILQCVNIKTSHQQKIRRQVNLKSDLEVNMQLWDFIIKETDWVSNLLRALKLNKYFYLLDILKTALSAWESRGCQ